MNEALMNMLERSRAEGKGITLYLAGQSVAMVVTEVIGSEAVKGRNQEHDHILVRLDQVAGAAMN